ncbi:phage portal protein [Pueribacillus sp. YX66]|uniref:phage portal protein n=1 Tax=Pueribacillus sp. YX66 TaxID=3229242 RepID=UPI00358D2974
MFKRAFNAVRRWLYNLGILKGIQSLENHKDIPINEEMYRYIDMWRQLYSGYHEDWHKLTYKTIDGTKERKMDTLNMAKVSANEMASLVYNEKCEISIGDNENETSEFVFDVFKNNKFSKKFQDYLEYSFAMGGMVVKPYVENDEIKLSFVTADCFVPVSWSNDTIREGVFINQIQRRDKTYTHLEWHEWINGIYTVTNELYESRNGTDLGVPVPLNTLKEYESLEPVVGMTSIEKPLFVYFKPNTANNIDTQSPLGISLFANALDTMKAIDVAFDSFNREFRLGKKRIIVPEHMVKSVVDPMDGRMHRYFDTSDETYEALPGEMDDFKIHDISVELRVEEHIAAINAMLNLFAMQTGFSSGTFTFDGQSMKTATEVISEQSKTFKSKQSHEIVIEEGLKELIDAILALAKQYSLFIAKDDYEVSIAFDDSIAEDKGAEIDKQVKLVQAELQSRVRAISEIFGITEEEALKVIEEIANESRQMMPEPPDDSHLFGDRE